MFSENIMEELKKLTEEIYDSFILNINLHPIYFVKLSIGKYASRGEEIDSFIRKDIFSKAQKYFNLPREKFEKLKNCRIYLDDATTYIWSPEDERWIRKSDIEVSPRVYVAEDLSSLAIQIPCGTSEISPPKNLDKSAYIENVWKIRDAYEYAFKHDYEGLQQETMRAALRHFVYSHANLQALHRMSAILHEVCEVFGFVKDIQHELKEGISDRVAASIAKELDKKYPSLNLIDAYLEKYRQWFKTVLSGLGIKDPYYRAIEKVKQLEKNMSLKEIIKKM
jgi:hypothetical protein